MEAREFRLLNEFQRDFPLVPTPYASVAHALGASEEWVLSTLRRHLEAGSVSRVGMVFRPGSVGASTLAAIAVPAERLCEVARRVGAHRGVNHNYEREHRLNLWFVASAPDPARLGRLLRTIECECALAVIDMPLVADYHIDLGFDLREALPKRRRPAARTPAAPLDADDRRLVAVLQEGLPLTSRPYAAIAARAAWNANVAGESRVLDRLRGWVREGTVKRAGVIVRHRPLGFTANAMAVWDVPDERVDALGAALAQEAHVTLCYRRARALPAWRYNLFCMIHGRDRDAVDALLGLTIERHRLGRYPHARLFSRQAFTQRGARHFDGPTIDG